MNMMPPEISDSLPRIARPPSSTVSVRESAGPLATIRVKSFEGKSVHRLHSIGLNPIQEQIT